MGQQFALNVCNFELDKEVVALYPFRNFDSCFCWNTFMAIGTYVDETDARKNKDFFDDWQTIIHEYGHYLQSELDINNIKVLMEYLRYGPEHSSYNNHMGSEANDGKGNKLYGAKLAWTEAWATVYSLITIDYYKTGYYSENQYLGTSGANIKNAFNRLNYYNNNINNTNSYQNTYRDYMCDGQEDAIIMFMLELYNNDFYGLSGFLKTATKAGTYYFSHYANNLYIDFSDNINEIGIIMAKYQLAPGNFTINNLENLNYDVSPQVSWILNGSLETPLEYVEFHFLNKNGELLYKTSQELINANYSDTITFEIPINQWQNGLNNLKDKEVYLSVVGYNNQDPITGGYYSNTIKIEINFPVYFYSLNDDSISYSLIGAWNISELDMLTIRETFNDVVVNKISENAFLDNVNIKTIIIPSSIKQIGSFSFKNCSLLSKVNILGEKDEIINLGEDVFDGCSINLSIIVPKNKIAEYKNSANWNEYKGKIFSDANNYDEITLSCTSEGSIDVSLKSGYNIIYKLNINCAKSYKFYSNSNIKMKIYDYAMEEVYTGENVLTCYLNPGIYYFDIRYSSNSENGIFSLNYCLTWPNSVTKINFNENNDITTNMHQNHEGMKHGLFYCINTKGAGFYKIKLNTENIDSNPEGVINVYDDLESKNMLNRYYIDELNIYASSIVNENDMYVYLPHNGYYYLEIILFNLSYDKIELSIENVEKNTIDYIESLHYINFNVLFEFETSMSHFEEVKINQLSEIQLDVISYGNIIQNIPIYIFERVYDLTTKTYKLEMKLEGQIANNNTAPVYTLIFEPGIYYFGYHNNITNIEVNFALRRIVDYEVDMQGTLVADPVENQGYALGSEVSFNNGLCDDYTITEGFTRSIYLMVEDRLTDPMSRLDYAWYSSNENIAKVTEYGTVLGMPVDEDVDVTIYAILKADPSVVYYKTFTILNDTSENQIEIECTMDYSFNHQNGTYQLELDNTNSPFPMIQYYSWNIVNYSDEMVEMDQWGIITSTGETEVLLVGSYSLNTRVTILIFLTIYE